MDRENIIAFIFLSLHNHIFSLCKDKLINFIKKKKISYYKQHLKTAN